MLGNVCPLDHKGPLRGIVCTGDDGKMAIFSGKQRARLEGLEPPTRCYLKSFGFSAPLGVTFSPLLSPPTIVGSIERGSKRCQKSWGSAHSGSKGPGALKSAGNQPDLRALGKARIMKNTQRRPRRPSDAPDRRYGEEGVSRRQRRCAHSWLKSSLRTRSAHELALLMTFPGF
jgi:hypothetical protein